jgi:hypothetical protein
MPEKNPDDLTIEDLPPTITHPGARHNKLLLHWKAPEFIIHHRGVKWFLTAGIILILLIAYAIYTRSATMAIVFIILGGVYYLTHNQHPKIIDIKVTELGIFMGEKFFPYNMINSFSIIYHPPYIHHINLRLADKTLSRVAVQLDVQDPVAVRKLLVREIPEVEGDSESFTEMLIRMLRL